MLRVRSPAKRPAAADCHHPTWEWLWSWATGWVSQPQSPEGAGVQGGRGRAFPPARPSVLRTSPSSPGLCWTQEGDLEASDGGWHVFFRVILKGPIKHEFSCM